MSRYRLVKNIPTPFGAWGEYGGTYRYLWLTKIAAWFATLCPDLRGYRTVDIEALK